MKLTIVSGSPREESITVRVALHVKSRFTQALTTAPGWIDLRKTALPPIQQVWKSLDQVPAEFQEVAETMLESQAFIVVTPEYNGSYSPAMKNLFDHFPKQSRKVFGIVTASTGVMGGMRASQQMLQLVPALGGIACPTMLITPQADKKFDEQGALLESGFQKSIDQFEKEFLWLCQQLITEKS
jgi:NAD(P)H-dependent FMN reductase